METLRFFGRNREDTSRGGLVDTKTVIEALKTRHVGNFGMDGNEEEDGLFSEDHLGDCFRTIR